MKKLKVVILISLIPVFAGCNESDNESPPSVFKDAQIDKVVVFESKGSIQCESNGQSREESARKLIEIGIDVIESKCAYDDSMSVTTVCGAGTNEIIVHEIPAQSLIDAEKIGFTSSLEIENDFTVYECEI